MPDKRLVNTLRLGAIIGAAAMLSASATSAWASDSGMTFGGEAKVVCSAHLTPGSAAADAGARALGQVSEFCNDPKGFQVWVDYPESLANAQLMVDGVAVTLTSGGATQIDQAATPGKVTHTLTLQSDAAGDVTVRIVPL